MAVWQQFLVIAGAHFLALLSPGPDFFLIVRSAVVNGVRVASGVCVGIALANGVYITLAISGVAVVQEVAGLFALLKWAGCAYLAWLGWRFLNVRGDTPALDVVAKEQTPGGWWRECHTGFLSGILNPKNSLFYASLFSLGFERDTPMAAQLAYGAWMFCAVLLWDLCIARAAGHPPVVRRFMAHVGKVERVTGVVLVGLAFGIAWAR
ncbi:MAG: LysE family translocator [Rhodocyclales bacterium]|nr:LysE family translocator [Rhodocyclales bacterium]